MQNEAVRKLFYPCIYNKLNIVHASISIFLEAAKLAVDGKYFNTVS